MTTTSIVATDNAENQERKEKLLSRLRGKFLGFEVLLQTLAEQAKVFFSIQTSKSIR
jgi:hypothetical protein